MDKIKQWTILISAVSIISGILLSLIPEGKLRPAYKTLISVVLVYAFMSPLINSRSIDFDISEYIKDNYDVSENYDKYALLSVVSSAEKAIEETLYDFASEANISCDFSVKCDIDSGEVAVKEIIISGVLSPDMKEKTILMISELGFDKDTIIFKGEADE